MDPLSILSGEPEGCPAGTIILPLGGLWVDGYGEPLVLLPDEDLRTRFLRLLDPLEYSTSLTPLAVTPNAWFEGSDDDVI